MKNINYGWLFSAGGWLVCTLSIPFFPYPPNMVLLYPVHDYFFHGIFGIYAAYLLVIWIPVGLRAGKAYKKRGVKRALRMTILACVATLLFLYFFFYFFAIT